MRSIRQLGWVLAVVLVTINGCGRKHEGPPSTKTDSSGFAGLQEKVDFLHQYVAFQRTYESLDFDITYHNNSGGLVPGPSDWDIRLVATVPADEFADWIPPGIEPTPQDCQWLETIPTDLDLAGINEWYRDGKCVIGFDRQQRIVAYRRWTW